MESGFQIRLVVRDPSETTSLLTGFRFDPVMKHPFDFQIEQFMRLLFYSTASIAEFVPLLWLRRVIGTLPMEIAVEAKPLA